MQGMVIEVTRRIAAHPRYAELLGDNPPTLFADNHRHHAMFMDEVFQDRQFELLAVTLPWVYHAYHAHGVHYDYFQIELGFWRDAVAAALPAEAAAEINAVYDWMLAEHPAVIALAERRSLIKPGISPTLADSYSAFSDALLASDDARLLALCRGLRDGGMTLPVLLQEIVAPAMQQVGLLWEEAKISVADEHQATAIVNRVLASLYYDQPFPDGKRGRALVAATVNEFHELGAWMVATCLEMDGWDVSYLGANVPADALVQKARDTRPAIVGLSASMPFNLRALRSAVSAIKAELPDAKVMVGGQVFQFLPKLGDGLGADACLRDCDDAVTWARNNAGVGAGGDHVV